MSILLLLVILMAIGVALWFLNRSTVPVDPKIKWLINLVLLVCAVLIVLYAFGIWDAVKGARVPRI